MTLKQTNSVFPSSPALHQGRGVLRRPAVRVGSVQWQRNQRRGRQHVLAPERLQPRPLLCLPHRYGPASPFFLPLEESTCCSRKTDRCLSSVPSVLLFPVCSAKPIERERCFGASNQVMELLSWDARDEGPKKHCPCAGDLRCQHLG